MRNQNMEGLVLGIVECLVQLELLILRGSCSDALERVSNKNLHEVAQ
jgi:hypothetical protein